MAVQLSESFQLWSALPLDNRTVYDSFADMTAMPDFKLHDGLMAVIKGDATHTVYQWFSDNTDDTLTGLHKWRPLKIGSSNLDIDSESLEINSYEELQVKLKTDGGIKKDSDGLQIDAEAANDILYADILDSGDGIEYVEKDITGPDPSDPSQTIVTGKKKVLRVDTNVIATKKYVDDEIKDAMSDVVSFDVQRVSSLADIADLDTDGNITGLKQDVEADGVTPKVDDDGNPVYVAKDHVMYLVPQSTDNQKGADIYDEYIVSNGKLELIGNTDIDFDAIGGVLLADLTANQSVGGVVASDSWTKGTKLEDIIRKILVKEIAATCRLTPSTAFGVVEEGSTIASQTMTVAVTLNSASKVTGVELFVNNVSQGTATVTTGLEGSYTITCPALTADSTVKAVVTYLQSDGVTSNSCSTQGTYDFVYATYYGVASAVPTTSAEVTALATKKLQSSVAGTNSYTSNNEYLILATPYTCSQVLDTGTNYKLNWNKTVVAVNVTLADGTSSTVNYNVYATGDPGQVTNYNLKFS